MVGSVADLVERARDCGGRSTTRFPGDARFNSPRGIAGGNGHIDVADANNHRIVQVQSL
jgi:hypothetical protein